MTNQTNEELLEIEKSIEYFGQGYDVGCPYPSIEDIMNHIQEYANKDKKCKHTNIWIICSGSMLWCYECGAIRPNVAGNPKQKIYWQPPSHSKVNPAMADKYPAQSWKEQSNV